MKTSLTALTLILALAGAHQAAASGAAPAKPAQSAAIEGYYLRLDEHKVTCANTYKVAIDEDLALLELKSTDGEIRTVIHYGVAEGYRKGNKFYEETFRPAYGGNSYNATVVEFSDVGMSTYELQGRHRDRMTVVPGTGCDYEKLN